MGKIIEKVGRSPICNYSNIVFPNDLDKKKGFFYALSLRCTWIVIGKKALCRQPLQAILKMRNKYLMTSTYELFVHFVKLGKGIRQCYATLMNMPPAMAKTNYAVINERFCDAYNAVLKKV